MSERNKVWGTLGNVIFEFQTSPVYGSVVERSGAMYTENRRILTRGSNGKLTGQKPVRHPKGLDLNRFSFDCKISGLILKTLNL